ncbi:hypothetical protein Q4S23_16235 [Morganella morganii]
MSSLFAAYAAVAADLTATVSSEYLNEAFILFPDWIDIFYLKSQMRMINPIIYISH